MIAPTLLVGLGGTGSKIVCKVSRLVTEEQREHLGFAVFDTDINELRDIQRDNPFIKIIQTSTKLSVGEYLNIDTHARDNWFPVNAILNSKTLTEGAGQVRAISRLAFDTALRAGKMEQLHEGIQELYKLDEGQGEQALRVIIVSSLAGGTGSGLILPVALYIKNYLKTHFRQSANITRGFFILPEVFDEVIPGQAERNNLRSNAYATLRELDAFLMKGDQTLPESYKDTVKIEFPRVGSSGYDEYDVRPYDFCFLFDAQNAEGSKLNSFNQYLDHAANCIYAQSIGSMNKRSNSSEDNTIRRLCEEEGRNRYAGAGSSMLIYPFEDIKEYIALKWAKECVSSQWLVFDNMYKDMARRMAMQRAQGIAAADVDPIKTYIESVESMAKNKDPFARAIVNSCFVYSEDGLTRVGDKWSEYVDALVQKITIDESAGQPDLDGQLMQVRNSLASLEGGKDSWENFQAAYLELEKYKAMIVRRSEDSANTIAYAMFKAPGEVTGDRLAHRLETYLRNNGDFVHPNAVRYFLYKTLELLKDTLTMVDAQNKDAERMFDGFSKAHFDDASTDDIEEGVESLTDRKISMLKKLTGKLTGEQEDLKSAYSGYLAKANEYRVNKVLVLVLQEGINYVKDLCDAFQNFFASFEARVSNMEKRIADIAKRYEHTKGMTARYVCSSQKCLKGMCEKMPYTGSSMSIDSKLAEEIYNRVRKYAMISTKPQNDSYFVQIFEEGILGYFKKTLMQMYGSEVDMDIIQALEAEAEYEKGLFDSTAVEQYVKDTIRSTRALSVPFIERPLGEERDPIYACAYNTEIDPHNDSPRSALVSKELKNAGGVEDPDVGKNMILFYQSIYGLRANNLSKFAPPEQTLTSNRNGGEYYKAYFELIAQIHPEAHKSRAITPHIDRWWHVITKMPDLDEENQKMQENRIYSAFFWGMLARYVELCDVTAERREYRLKIDQLKMKDGLETLVVSNGTPCDHLYEVLDSFAIYPELVEKTLERVEHLIIADVDDSVLAEESYLLRQLERFWIEEFPMGVDNHARSVFDLPLLMKRSLKSESYNEESLIQILRTEIAEISKYLRRIVSPKEYPIEMAKILDTQFERYLQDIEEENTRNRDIYHDYLFSRSCSIIAAAYAELGLGRKEREVLDIADELKKTGKASAR